MAYATYGSTHNEMIFAIVVGICHLGNVVTYQDHLMKLAITSTDEGASSTFSATFGRAPCFYIWDSQTETATTIDNLQNKNAAQGAGIQAAQTVVKSGAKAVITGHCGPKAYRVLAAAGVRVFYADVRTVEEAIGSFQRGDLIEATSADVEGHWA